MTRSSNPPQHLANLTAFWYRKMAINKFIKVNKNLIFLFFTQIVKVIMIISKSNKNISRNGLINSYILKLTSFIINKTKYSMIYR